MLSGRGAGQRQRQLLHSGTMPAINNLQDRMSKPLKYISAYPAALQQQVQKLIDEQRLGEFLNSKYPVHHRIANDSDLRDYVMALKNKYLKKAEPLSKIVYDNRIHVVNNALGTHTYTSRVQGDKLKRKNELRISSIFIKAPEELLRMIVVHELAHLKEKQHNKDFYQLCEHMLPQYHQLEFDARLYLTLLEL
jgi:predicted metal-dependent hydrolase